MRKFFKAKGSKATTPATSPGLEFDRSSIVGHDGATPAATPNGQDERWIVVSPSAPPTPAVVPPSALEPPRPLSILPPGASPPNQASMLQQQQQQPQQPQQQPPQLSQQQFPPQHYATLPSPALQQRRPRLHSGGATGLPPAPPPRDRPPLNGSHNGSHNQQPSQETFAFQHQYEASLNSVQERDRDKDKGQKVRGFFGVQKDRDNNGRDKDHQRERGHNQRDRHDQDTAGEITRMIGYLTGLNPEDWSIVLEVCERASSSDSVAKEAARALRREFKYAEPPSQLAAARLWAIMLRNCSEIFIAHTTTKKFLDVVEDVCASSRTSPVVRERLLEVLAGAAFAHRSANPREGFTGSWRRLKLPHQPDDGIPFNEADPMLNPPNPRQKRRQQVPSAAEELRRLFEECEVARGNAQLLNQALTFTKPTDLPNNSVIKEFHSKCMASHELVAAQIPWATAAAEQARARALELGPPQATLGVPGQTPAHAETAEEQLLATLLLANQELVDAFRVYDDLQRVGEERAVEARSRVEVRLDRSQIQFVAPDGSVTLEPTPAGQSSRSPSPASFRTGSHASTPLPPLPPQAPAQQPVARAPLPAPPPAPVGPRRAPGNRSRSPSPTRSTDDETPPARARPSQKALGKRRALERDPEDDFDPDDLFKDPVGNSAEPPLEDDDDSMPTGPRAPWATREVHYVYDAAAERAREREAATRERDAVIREREQTARMLDGRAVGEAGSGGATAAGAGAAGAVANAGVANGAAPPAGVPTQQHAAPAQNGGRRGTAPTSPQTAATTGRLPTREASVVLVNGRSR